VLQVSTLGMLISSSMDGMKTTVDIPEEALEEAMRHAGAKTKREAVVVALEEYNRRRRLARLVDELGTFDGFLDGRELESLRSEG
jgi:Arc/MetJ family transcription regulator